MRSFLGIPFGPWLGKPTARPFASCGQSGIAVPIMVSWATYGASSAVPNYAVDVNLGPTGQVTLIQKVRSVYVDNLGVNFPVYIYFPSTGFTVAAKANSAVWYPAITNDLNALIVAEGVSDNDTRLAAANTQATTVVYFTDIDRVPYVDEEVSQGVALARASTNVGRGGNFSNSFYGAISLGDQSNQASLASLSAAQSVPLFLPGPGPGGRQNTGFYYITGLWISFTNITTPSGTVVGNVLIRDDDMAATILAVPFAAPLANYIGYNMSGGFNEKLDATHLWSFVSPGTGGLNGGSATCHVRYTYQN